MSVASGQEGIARSRALGWSALAACRALGQPLARARRLALLACVAFPAACAEPEPAVVVVSSESAPIGEAPVASGDEGGEDPSVRVDDAAVAPARERVLRLDLLDNGDFSEGDLAAAEDADGSSTPEEGGEPSDEAATAELEARPPDAVPWWRTTNGVLQLEPHPSGRALRTEGAESAEQPVAAYAPLARSIEVRGSMRGRGRVLLLDGSGSSARLELDSPGTWREFRLNGSDFAAQVGRDPVPRFLVRLESGGENEAASWRDLSATVELPCPSEPDLRAEVLALLREVVTPWLERGRDEEPPLATGFLCHFFDAVSGERITTSQTFLDPLFGELQEALHAEEVPEWRAGYERFLASFLELCFDPGTGLPRLWDPVRDEPVSDWPVEIALVFDFLQDVAERGPEPFRARALAAAIRLGDAVLAHGLQPDGNVGASYFPLDGTVNTAVAQLRRFDVPAQLARLSVSTGDPRYLHVAHEALAIFEFTHYWSGTWSAIDPGFDDDFGHYGARATTIALAVPEERAFRRFALEGFAHYAPLWRDALRYGGNVAADQVRCWSIALDLARCEPALKPEIAPLLAAAARMHFKGEQYEGGAWGDVTIYQFDPKSNLQVGDYPGTPQNLLNGLSSLYAGLDVLTGDGLLPPAQRDELRAMYTAVLRSTVEVYRRPYGFLLDRGERRGVNSAAGSLRLLIGLRKMLAAL